MRSSLVAAVALSACAPSSPPTPPGPSSSVAPSIAASAPPALAPSAGATDVPASTAEVPPAPPVVTLADARALLFPSELGESPPACDGADDTAKIRCLVGARYAKDSAAATEALAMLDRTGAIAGLDHEQDMDGGYRGMLHLVPELPVGARRKHLAWTRAALDDIDVFFDGLAKKAPEAVKYRHHALAFRFFRSVHARTPSAYAEGWSVAYNVDGSLFVTADAARETLFHEIFHLNDQARGSWSPKALGAIYDAIVARCGTKIPCLHPYAPSETTVRNGTYYAFQPGNGVVEYAAELALRYYREERAALAGKPVKPPFKCGPPENLRAWDLLRAEFFGNADVVAPCANP